MAERETAPKIKKAAVAVPATQSLLASKAPVTIITAATGAKAKVAVPVQVAAKRSNDR